MLEFRNMIIVLSAQETSESINEEVILKFSITFSEIDKRLEKEKLVTEINEYSKFKNC